MEPTPKQATIIQNKHRFKVVVCGRKFGKTEVAIEHILGESLEKGDKEIIYVASTFTEARDIAWSRMKKRFGKMIVGEPNESRLEMRLKSQDGSLSNLQLKSWETV